MSSNNILVAMVTSLSRNVSLISSNAENVNYWQMLCVCVCVCVNVYAVSTLWAVTSL